MRTMQVTCECAGIDLVVEFTATPYVPATWHEPEEGGEVIVENIYLGDVEVSEILSQWALDRCYDMAVNTAPDIFRDEIESDQADYAEYREDLRREMAEG